MSAYSANLAYFRAPGRHQFVTALDTFLEQEGWVRAAAGDVAHLQLGILDGNKGWLGLIADDFAWLARRSPNGKSLRFVDLASAMQQPAFLVALHQELPYSGMVLVETDGTGKAAASGAWLDVQATHARQHHFFDLAMAPCDLRPRISALKSLWQQDSKAGSEAFCRRLGQNLLANEQPRLADAVQHVYYRRLQADPVPPKHVYADGQLMQLGDVVLWQHQLFPARICGLRERADGSPALLLQDCVQIDAFEVALADDLPCLVVRDQLDFAASAISVLEQRAQQRDAHALTVLGNLALNGIAIQRDSNRAEQLLQAAVQLGYVEAQFLLGLQYSLGELLPRNDASAYTLLRGAARAGHAPAALAFGNLYLDGRGVSRDLRQALRWIQQAAQSGLRDAQSKLGYLYSHPESGLHNPELARTYLTQAAQAGDAAAQYMLGLHYLNAEPPARDYQLARQYFLQAEKQGLMQASYHLGQLAERAHGMPAQPLLAFAYYRKAASSGVPEAMYALSQLYLRGLGVATDLALAQQWQAQAAAHGYRPDSGHSSVKR